MEKEIYDLVINKKYKILGTGYVSTAYEIEIKNKKYIILQGQISNSFKYYEFSYNNLLFLLNEGNPYIKTVQFPHEELYLIKPTKENNFFKNGALMYKEINGIVFYEKYFNKINIENIADSIAKFLIELYKIPIKDKNIEQYRQEQIKVFNRNICNVKEYFGNKNIDKLICYEKEFLDYINKFEDFHYTHGDFWQENLIISEDYQNLLGVIDFDNFGINDIARDYASLFNLGYDFINKIIEKSEEIIEDKEAFIRRVKLYEKFIIIGCFAFLNLNNNENKKERLEIHIKQLKKADLI